MRLKSYVYRLMGAVCAFAAVACVDRSFNLDDVSTEVTLGSGTTTLPLGYLGKKTLGELLGDREIDGLVKDEEGNYSFVYAGENSVVEIEDITAEFEIPEIETLFKADYPQYEVDMESIEISEADDIAVDLGVLEEFRQVGASFAQFDYLIPEGVAMPTLRGSYSYSISDKHIEMNLPDQIENLEKVYFYDVEAGHHGAPIHLSVDFNDFADINGGGKLNYTIGVSGGTLTILDKENRVLAEECVSYPVEYDIAAGAESFDFVIYVESLTNTTAVGENHHLDIPLEITFDMELELETRAGVFSLEQMPHIELNADFEYGDAEVKVNPDVNLVECRVESGEPIMITGLPDAVKMVSNVTLKQGDNTLLSLYAHGLEWLGDYADDVEVVVSLPQYLVLHQIAGQGYEYDAQKSELVSTIAALERGVCVGVDALDFGEEGIVPDDGIMEIAFEPSVVAHFKDDANVKVSALEHDGSLVVSVGIEEAKLEMESVCGKIDYAYQVEESFDLEELKDLSLEIEGVGLKPIIEVNISHPLTMESVLSGSVVPVVGGVEREENSVSFSDINIAAATFADGNIEPIEVSIIIADESLREQYSDARYTFVACDVTKLFVGTLPEALNVNLDLSVDKSKVQTIHIADDLSVEYGYNINVPLSIDDSLAIRYKDKVESLSSTFEKLMDYNFKVGDITVIAIVENTTPLEFSADVKCKDVEGEMTEVQVYMDDDSKILGSVDGMTPKTSTLRLSLDLGEDGRLSNLAAVDIIEFMLSATSAAEGGSVAINDSQYVSVMLQLELKGGITVDLDTLL